MPGGQLHIRDHKTVPGRQTQRRQKFAYTIDVMVPKEKQILKKVHSNNIMSTEKKRYHFPKPGSTELIHPPVIVGSGPAGLFCAWYLARAGYRPLVLERGEMAVQTKRNGRSFLERWHSEPGLQCAVRRGWSRNFF